MENNHPFRASRRAISTAPAHATRSLFLKSTTSNHDGKAANKIERGENMKKFHLGTIVAAPEPIDRTKRRDILRELELAKQGDQRPRYKETVYTVSHNKKQNDDYDFNKAAVAYFRPKRNQTLQVGVLQSTYGGQCADLGFSRCQTAPQAATEPNNEFGTIIGASEKLDLMSTQRDRYREPGFHPNIEDCAKDDNLGAAFEHPYDYCKSMYGNDFQHWSKRPLRQTVDAGRQTGRKFRSSRNMKKSLSSPSDIGGGSRLLGTLSQLSQTQAPLSHEDAVSLLHASNLRSTYGFSFTKQDSKPCL
eukprot:TRINITY_DN2749_c0_g3_i1.p1 TRINITY_DN2749_c0_g3~~TRINITY_DN2749_c0_g3_i1.p1  ORF type:complete len:304 (-),score=31.91 TRINITY_DN2749_c0_g3_i1:216-1127(-)